MSGKVVLITGASSGLGEFIAYEYAKRGARLALIAREKPESHLNQVADAARGLGSPDVLFIYADVSKVEECRNAYSSTNDVTKFEPVMDINFWGSIYPTHVAIPHLKKTHGKIIVNSSYAGLLHPANSGIYSASKAALISFFESLDSNVGSHLIGKDLVAVVPVMEVEPCTKAIVDGVCKGATSISEPRMMKAINPLNPGQLVAEDRFPGQHVARDKLQEKARRGYFSGGHTPATWSGPQSFNQTIICHGEGFSLATCRRDNDAVK
nr:glucose/ribitol dehydrogenase [Tanacetum cinerariifolium]